MKKVYLNLIILITLTMAVVQAPLFYYYTFGFVSIFIGIPYIAIGVGLTIWSALIIEKLQKKQRVTNQKLLVGLVIVTGLLSTLVGERLIETLDWQFRFGARNGIVKEIREGRLGDYPYQTLKLTEYNVPPISTAGNEVSIESSNESLTIEFYINRGFLDHYSAFVFTDDPEKIEILESRVSRGIKGNKRMNNNWYRVSY